MTRAVDFPDAPENTKLVKEVNFDKRLHSNCFTLSKNDDALAKHG